MFENARPSWLGKLLNRGPITRFGMGSFCLVWNAVIALQLTAFILMSSEITRLLGGTWAAEIMVGFLNPTYYLGLATVWTYSGCREWFILRRDVWGTPTRMIEAMSSPRREQPPSAPLS
jgi:cellulose synthase/poly-beta-1,6-N-acetylglucosamine synthase-like glycosyltransferase